MAECIIVGNGTKEKQLGIYPIGNDGRPTGDVIVPNGITSLYRYIFYDNDSVTAINLPDTLTMLNGYCFAEMGSLTEIELPKNINEITEYSFYNSAIKKCTVNSNSDTVTIGNYAFAGSKLEEITLSKYDDIQGIQIGYEAFYQTNISNTCINLLLSKAINLGDYAFGYCPNITDIETITGYRAFWYCDNLEKVTIKGLPPKSTETKGSTFFQCKNLKTVIFDLPDDCNLTKISDNCFSSCESLETIEIPSTVTEIGSSAFSNCTSLSNITVHDDNQLTLGEYSFRQCANLTNTDVENLLNHTQSLYLHVFEYCTNLTELNIPFCWSYMFNGCTNLKNVTVDSTLTSGNLGTYTFNKCTNLEYVELKGNVVTLGSSFLAYCSALKTLKLPSTITDQTSLTYSVKSYYYFLMGCTALENIELGDDWNASIRFDVSENITVNSMVSMFNALKDLTDSTTKTLTLGSVNLAKLTDEQKSIATNKNWTLA